MRSRRRARATTRRWCRPMAAERVVPDRGAARPAARAACATLARRREPRAGRGGGAARCARHLGHARGADRARRRHAGGSRVRVRRRFGAAEQDTAAYAFARAAVTGRLVQQRGLRGASLVGEVERWALRSRELDPDFRDGAATRLLGTLYVIAPAIVPRARRFRAGPRAARGARAASIPTCSRTTCASPRPTSRSAIPSRRRRTCASASARRNALRRDDQQLLDQLVATAGNAGLRRAGLSAQRAGRGGDLVRPLAREDPERGRQRREVGDHREHEGERREHAELTHRRQIRERRRPGSRRR